LKNQRLVYGGKELQDNLKLSEYGIGESGVIFLVESSNSQIPQQNVTTHVTIPIQPQVPVLPQVQMSNCNYNNNYPCQQVQIPYEPIDDDSVFSEQRIRNVLNLRYWVRNYCILGMILTGLNIFNCIYCIVPFLMFSLGFIGTRNLNRCLLIFPLLISTFIGFGLTSLTIYLFIYYYNPMLFLPLFIGILHLLIFVCICKLMSRIGKLTHQEWWQARLRIRSAGCCSRA